MVARHRPARSLARAGMFRHLDDGAAVDSLTKAPKRSEGAALPQKALADSGVVMSCAMAAGDIIRSHGQPLVRVTRTANRFFSRTVEALFAIWPTSAAVLFDPGAGEIGAGDGGDVHKQALAETYTAALLREEQTDAGL